MVADKKLLLVAICVLSQWTREPITAAYRLSEPECVKSLAQQHQTDQKRAGKDLEGYTLVLADAPLGIRGLHSPAAVNTVSTPV